MVAVKSLKEQNRWLIWLIIAINTAFLYGVVEANAIELDGVRSIFTDTSKLVPFGVAVVVATVLNGLLSPNKKAQLVFLRWRHALPGHEAFSRHMMADARIDSAEVATALGGRVPSDPGEQNRVWYRLYKTVENDPAVSQVHRDFLLTRDYAALALLFLLFYGGAGFYSIPSTKIALIYVGLLVIQLIVVRQSAVHYGVEFVTTVLARITGKPAKAGAPKRPRSAPPASG
jgi:hypothetical protein